MGITIDGLQIEITENSNKAVDGLNALTKSLEKLKKTTTGLESSIKGLNFKEFNAQMRELATALKPLDGFKTQVGTVINSLKHFKKTSEEFNKFTGFERFGEQIRTLVDALIPITTMGKSQLGSILNQLKKFPEVMSEFNKIDSKEIEKFAEKIKEAVIAIKPLADEMNKIASGFAAFPSRIQRLITANEKLVSSNNNLGKSYNVLGVSFKSIHLKMLGLVYVARRLVKSMSDWVTESTSYVENLNLFRISMRDASDEALNFAFKVREIFGIDPSEWIRFQAVFQNMATGFGIAGEKANIMSKNLTQLGYDLATVFNVQYETAMQKLQSALAGQPRPMREWGFDMSEATLKLVALKHGVEKNVEAMTQYEKSQLRFLQLMETATKQGIVGNFARELHTPANALRILNQQLLFFKRTLGDAIIPLLIKVLPYLQALVIVMTNIARTIASMMGFELPIIDYSGLGVASSYADDLEDGLDGSTESAKALKRALAGFDEINLLQDPTGAGANVPVMGGGLDLDLSQFDYDFLGKIQNRANEIADKLQEPFENMLKLAIKIGVVMLAWKIANSVYSFFTGDAIGKLIKGVGGLGGAFLPCAAAIGALIALVILAYKNNDKFRETIDKLWAAIKTALTPVVEKLSEALTWLWQNVIVPLGAIILDVLIVAFDGLVYVCTWLWQNVLQPLGAFLLESLIPGFLEIATAIGNILAPIVEGLIKLFQGLLENVLKPLVLWLGDTFKPVFEIVGDGIKTVIEGLRTTFDGLIKFIAGVFTSDWEKAWEGVKQIFKGIMDTLYGVVKIPLNLIIEAINTVIRGLNKLSIKIPDWVPGFGGKSWGINIPTIPKLTIPEFKLGGFPDLGQLFIAREAGAEMVGSIGNRAAVANNEQIVEAVSRGVYEAMMAVMQMRSGGTDSNKEFVLNINGKQFAKATLGDLNDEAQRMGFNPLLGY